MIEWMKKAGIDGVPYFYMKHKTVDYKQGLFSSLEAH
jgi:hypothetical protein